MFDTIEITPVISEHREILCAAKINNKKIVGLNDGILFDIGAFLNRSKDNRPWWIREQGRQPEKDMSGFFPFTCTCGEAGCAGIWQGILSKHRRKSVEWRIPKNMGYEFLDKSFYRFNRGLYEAEQMFLWNWLHENKDEELWGYGESDYAFPLSETLHYYTNPK